MIGRIESHSYKKRNLYLFVSVGNYFSTGSERTHLDCSLQPLPGGGPWEEERVVWKVFLHVLLS